MKRLMDLVVVILAAPLWIPLFLLTGILVAAVLGRPVFFRQERAGKDGHPFRIIKFRTMFNSRDASGSLLPDAERMPRFGRVLRMLSLDELPEFLNVLSGKMSLVGPRPLPVTYVSRYTKEQARRLLLRPGITGWAQVKGRNRIDWPERFKLDIWYVDHQSLLLDVGILLMTIWVVLRQKGVSAENEPTMPEFMGNPPEES